MIQSPKIIHLIPSQDLPPKHAIVDSFSPVDPSISPSHHSSTPQDPFIPPSLSHFSLPNQDQNIPCTTHLTISTPSHELASIDPPLHANVPSTPSTNTPPCQDQLTPSHGPIPSTPLYDSIPSHDPLILPHDPLLSQDQSTPLFAFHDPTPS